MAVAESALPIRESSIFKIDAPEWAAEADNKTRRRKIKKMLDVCSAAVNTALLSKESLKSHAEDIAEKSQGTAVMEGVVWIFANYDATADTGIVEENKPVAFCTKTGNCVTGINSAWGSDEYKVVGIALKEHKTTGEPKRIPVRLIREKEDQFEYADMGIVRAGGSPAADFSSIGTLGDGFKKMLDEPSMSGTLVEFSASNQWVYVLKPSQNDESKYAWRRLSAPQPVINPTPYRHSGGLMLWVSRVGSVWVVRRPVIWPLIYRVQLAGQCGNGAAATFNNAEPFNSQVANIAQINTGAFPGNSQGNIIQINCPLTQFYRVAFDITLQPVGDPYLYQGWSAVFLNVNSVSAGNDIRSEFRWNESLREATASPAPSGLNTQWNVFHAASPPPLITHHGEDILRLSQNDTLQLSGALGFGSLHDVTRGWLTIEPLNKDLF